MYKQEYYSLFKKIRKIFNLIEFALMHVYLHQSNQD